MRKQIVIFPGIFVVAAFLGLAGVSLAQGDPHGSYSALTDSCAACHRAHTGLGSPLLHASGQANAFCYTCHDGTGAPASPVVLTHGNLEVPGVEAGFGLDCIQCHDPHGSDNLYAIKSEVVITDSITTGPVLFTASSGPNSYDDGVSDPASRLCVTCHSNLNNPGYPMSNHEGGANHLGGHDYSGQDCTTCHSHEAGFMHGGGAGTGCIACHGHDAGTLYDPDATAPYAPGAEASQGSGTAHSHSAHTEIDADDQRGPGVYCDTCHDVNDFPSFASGVDSNNDGRYDLDETDVCDACHSPDGTYSGVNDPTIGAKSNWDSGIYQGDNLAAGKEKWCAGCHDEGTSAIQGVNAPNVAGDEDAATDYGIGYGFYKTGHGLPDGEFYPWTISAGSPLQRRGAGVACDACHDFSTGHIDGQARTYAQPGTPGSYQSGYRLKSMGGDVPLAIPRSNLCPSDPGYNEQVPVDTADFELCFSCHDSGPFTMESSTATNFRNESTGINAHYYHLAVYSNCGPGPRWASDWSGVLDSRISCVTCHNIHGSTRLSMVNDGTLVNHEPGLRVAYYNPSVSYLCGGPGAHDPTPPDVTLPDSTGTVWDANVNNVCSGCHGSCGFNELYTRTPFTDLAPVIQNLYGRVGGNVLVARFSEGVYSNPDISGDLTPSDLAYTDLDDGRTIVDVAHTAGENSATVSLSAALDSLADIGVDTLAAASGDAIYDFSGQAMDTAAIVVEDDSAPPAVSDQTPADGATNVLTDTNVTFTLSDSQSGVAWNTFSIQFSGSAGYARMYTAADTANVSRTGSYDSYDVMVDPDADFGEGETISVTVQVQDAVGNPTSVVWSFMAVAAAGPFSVVLYPSGLASNPGGYWTVPITDQWATYLDSNDGDSTYVTSNTGSQGAVFTMHLDDPSGLEGATIQSLTFHVYARYVSGWSPDPPAYAGVVNIGYQTGTNTVWEADTGLDDSGSYNLVSSSTYTTDSDGGPLDLADINNLQIAVRRRTSGGYPLRVTAISAEIVYTLSGASRSPAVPESQWTVYLPLLVKH